MCEDTVRVSHQHLLDSSLYGLNASFSKLAVIGYDVKNNINSEDLQSVCEIFQPVVQILNKSFLGFSLDFSTWEQFCQIFPTIEKYFVFRNIPESIKFGNLILSFTTSHGAPAICLDITEQNFSHNGEEEEDGQSSCKRIRMYQPPVVMHITTFTHLTLLQHSILEKLNSLKEFLPAVNTCGKYFIQTVIELYESKLFTISTDVLLTELRTQHFDVIVSTIKKNLKNDGFENFAEKHCYRFVRDILLLSSSRTVPIIIRALTNKNQNKH